MHPTKIVSFSLVALLVACGGAVDSDEISPSPDLTLDPANGPPPGPHGQPEEPPMLGAHAAKGAARRGGGGVSLLAWHNGAIMTSAHVQPVFWGAKWGDAAFAGDKIAGLDGFYAGLGNSAYANTNVEYTGTNGTVGAGVTTAPGLVDTSAAPSRAPKTSAILAEVCKMISSPVANGYYPVYTDTKRGGAGYCAWHSYGTCSGVPVQFGFFFDLDGDTGCDPKDASGLHSQGLAALANVSGHEYSEAITDPRNGGWWDAQGNENSDKCAWTFGASLVDLGGTQWKIQGNWSNAAYNASAGYKRGCIDGN